MLITRSRGGLYASYDQAFFDEETVIFTQAYGPHTIRMENMRRVTPFSSSESSSTMIRYAGSSISARSSFDVLLASLPDLVALAVVRGADLPLHQPEERAVAPRRRIRTRSRCRRGPRGEAG